MSKLTAKQQAFVNEYLIDLNATQAAIRAGYSKKTAAEMGAENLRKPQIAQAVAEAKEKRSERTQISADYVLMRLKQIDELDILDIYDPELRAVRPLEDWPKEWRTSISAIDISELFDYEDGEKNLAGIVKKLKFPDKVKNLELIGKHVDVQAFKDRVDTNVTGFSLKGIVDEIQNQDDGLPSS
jgi:phage terminase small subunit